MSDRSGVHTFLLSNGLQVTVSDVSRHYFGGYWQVALEVSCLIPLETAMFADTTVAADARRLLGPAVPFVRRLERMAVHGDEQETVRQQLLDRFERHLLPFMENGRFADRFIQTEYLQRSKKSSRSIIPGLP